MLHWLTPGEVMPNLTDCRSIHAGDQAGREPAGTATNKQQLGTRIIHDIVRRTAVANSKCCLPTLLPCHAVRVVQCRTHLELQAERQQQRVRSKHPKQ